MVSMNVKDYTKERCLVDEALKENKATVRVKSAPVIRFSMTSSTMGRLRGMLFGDYDDSLVLVPCCDMHTVGMRRDLDIAFLDSGGLMLESYRSVGSGKRVRCVRSRAVIERFACPEAPWFLPGDRAVLTVEGVRS